MYGKARAHTHTHTHTRADTHTQNLSMSLQMLACYYNAWTLLKTYAEETDSGQFSFDLERSNIQLKMCRACQGKPRVIPFKCYPANGKANLHLYAKIWFLHMESYIVLRHRHWQAEVHTHEHTQPPLFISMSTAIGFLIGYFTCHFTMIVAFFVLLNLNKNTQCKKM